MDWGSRVWEQAVCHGTCITNVRMTARASYLGRACRLMLLPWPWYDLFYSSASTAYSDDSMISCYSQVSAS